MDAFPAIAVLPFENPSGDPEQGYLARGFVEELVTELARFPTLEVIHHHTSQALGGAAVAELGAAYHLRGSVRRLGERLRIHAQLAETESGRQIWAERFDVPADGLLAVQDEIVARVASALRAEIDAVRLRGARRKPLSSLDVYDCWLRGMDHLRRGHWRMTSGRGPSSNVLWPWIHIRPARHAGLSLSHFNEWSCQLWERWEEKEQRAFEHASRAAALDDRDALIQIILGRILLYRRRWDEGAKHLERALELAPSDADVLANAALCRAYLGDPAAGALLAERASRLNPRYPEWYLPCAAVPLFLLGRDADAVALLSRSPRAFVDAAAFLAAAHGMLGHREEATRFADMFLAELTEKITFGRTPEPGEPLRWVLQVNPFRREEDAARFARDSPPPACRRTPTSAGRGP
jgi:TolB-like protein